MAIEVTEVKEAPKFPRAYRAIPQGFVVLFLDENSGIILIDNGSHIFTAGNLERGFLSCSRKDHWEPVNLTITHD